MQLYLPPPIMMTKDFLKLVFADKKRLLKMSEVRFINVPKYEELSVKNLFPHLKNDKTFMMYFPDKYPQGHPPDREYFFNVLNTLNTQYVSDIIKHANQLRNKGNGEDDNKECIEITDEWWQQLNEIPFSSSKYIQYV